VPGNTGSLVKSGYSFVGWNTASNGTGTTYAQSQTFTMGSANVTLYAAWTTNPAYTVTYDGNGSDGGSVPSDSTNYEQGQTVTALGNTGSLVKAGCSFAGWNTLADGTGTTYTQTQTFLMGSANVTLYAMLTATPTYTVTYNGNGNTTGSVPDDTVSYEQGQTVTVLGNTGDLTKTNYTFGGWNTLDDGTGTTYGATFVMNTDNVTLYAQWTAAIPVNPGTQDAPVLIVYGTTSLPVSGQVTTTGYGYYQISALDPSTPYRVTLTISGDVVMKLSNRFDYPFTALPAETSTYFSSSSIKTMRGNALPDAAGNIWVKVYGSGVGAQYTLTVSPATLDGWFTLPMELSYGTPRVGIVDNNDSYYHVSGLTPNAEYLVRITGMSRDVDLLVYSFADFTGSNCWSQTRSSSGDEVCAATADSGGNLWINVDGNYVPYGYTATYTLDMTAAPVSQGTAAAPMAISLGGNSTSVGPAGLSYYVVDPVPQAFHTITLTGLYNNVDMGVYSYGFPPASSVWQCGATGGSNASGSGSITCTTNYDSYTDLYIEVTGYLEGATFTLNVN